MNECNPYKVCVRSFTFNQAPYITATMDGFCRQQTQFPYICLIMDDASTDGEPEVIKQYLLNFLTQNGLRKLMTFTSLLPTIRRTRTVTLQFSC